MGDCIGMIKHLGPPSWWMTLSCLDLKWNEIYEMLSKSRGKEMTDDKIAAVIK